VKRSGITKISITMAFTHCSITFHTSIVNVTFENITGSYLRTIIIQSKMLKQLSVLLQSL